MPKIQYKGQSYELNAGESLLDCLERNGQSIKNSCRRGICQSCIMKCSNAKKFDKEQAGLREAHVLENYFMSCVCFPSEDMEVMGIEEDCIEETYKTKVIEQSYLNHNVLRLRLEVPKDYSFKAGQFVSLIRPGDSLSRSYSIASIPSDNLIELHIRLIPDGKMSNYLAEEDLCGQKLEISKARGDCTYKPDRAECPLTLVGSSTGLAPLLGIIRQALEAKHEAPIFLYIGAREQKDLYYQEAIAQLAREHTHFSYEIAPFEPDEKFSLAKHFANRCDQLDANLAYICGSPPLVKVLKKHAFLAGVSLKDIFFDSFEMASSQTA